MLEIGVSKGGSLDMWRDYLGPGTVIFGIDIDPRGSALGGRSRQVRIGSPDAPVCLAEGVRETAPLTPL